MTVYGLIRVGDCPSLGKDFDISMAFMPPIGFSFFAVYIAGTVPKPGNPLNGYQISVMDGVKAAEAIRSGAAGEQNRSIPIIAVTAYAMNGDQERFRNSDMDGYIAKPVDVPAIEKVLKHIKAFRS